MLLVESWLLSRNQPAVYLPLAETGDERYEKNRWTLAPITNNCRL